MDTQQTLYTILIVDDTPENIQILNETLRPHYKIKVATNGKKALSIATDNDPPDLILLDIMMPDMDGYEVFKHLQDDATTRKIPVIFVTAMNNAEEETKGMEIGAVDYITKPFNPSVVKARVKTHLYIKSAKNALENQNRILEKKVKKRTLQLETANHAKSEFLSIISHELRTPLNSIIGFNSLLLSDMDMKKEKREKFLAYVSSHGQALLTLINEMIELVGVETGEVTVRHYGFSLPQLIQDVIETVTPKIQEKKLTLSHTIAPGVSELLTGDNKRLHQVLKHLLHNAAKFTEKGTLSLEVVKEPSPPNKEILHFSVRDTGIGIPPDKQEHIFEHFTQLEPSLTRKQGGLGLGLTICKRFVPLLGGRIWLESEVGQGSVFHFTACFNIEEDIEF